MDYYDDEDRQLDQVNTLLDNKKVHCYRCRHFISEREDIPSGTTCDAFPDQIPSLILTGQVRHTKKHPGQDNNIVFEPKE